ncbi:unnamed protein product [Lampetra planeri]
MIAPDSWRAGGLRQCAVCDTRHEEWELAKLVHRVIRACTNRMSDCKREGSARTDSCFSAARRPRLRVLRGEHHARQAAPSLEVFQGPWCASLN